jgi:hypothetical protein
MQGLSSVALNFSSVDVRVQILRHTLARSPVGEKLPCDRGGLDRRA